MAQGCNWKSAPPFFPDLATLTMDAEITDLSASPVETSQKIQPDDEVAIVGYGCQSGHHVQDPSGTLRQRKAGIVKVLPPTAAANELTFNMERGEFYFYTLGMLHDDGAASLCPGDSGGPVYKLINNVWTVVGINSQGYWGKDESPKGVPSVNVHARLTTAEDPDAASSTNAEVSTAGWLRRQLEP